MSFMERQIVFGDWYECETNNGTCYVPSDLCEGTPEGVLMYCEAREVYEVMPRKGFGARLSAPGYMDRTEWSVFDTEEEAEAYLEEMYGEDEEGEEE